MLIPEKSNKPAIVLELKYKLSVNIALQQIKEKNYIEKVKHFHQVLLVGINYDDNKHHECIIDKVINK